MKIVIYSRVSTADKNSSIENQLKLAREWIDRRKQEGIIEKNNVEVEEIIDKGYSGSNMNRPGIMKIKKYINDSMLYKLKVIDMIIVKDVSRLGRNYIEVGTLINKVYQAKINLICINEQEEEMFNMDINTIMADFYSKDISIKTKSILDMNKRKGKYSIAKVPYGYRKNREDKYTIEIYEPEANIVEYIFKQYNKGKKIGEIVNELNKKDIYKKDVDNIEYKKVDIEKSNSIDWNYHKVYRILHNEFYKGTMVYNKSIGHIWEGKKRQYIHEDNWERIENHHPAII